MNQLPEHLRKAARSRTEQAEKQTRAALKAMTAANETISFTAVARKARVSTDFLYGHPTLRDLIERHRAKRSPVMRQVQHTQIDTTSTSAAVRALSAKLTEQRRAHQDEILTLRKALEIAHGENLELRRKLARYEPD